MSSRGGIYKGPGGELLHGDGKPVEDLTPYVEIAHGVLQAKEQRAAINRDIVLSRIRDYDRRWFGVMTTWNAEEIANRLRVLLSGKLFTFVTVNGNMNETLPPEVRTSQTMTSVQFSMLAPDHAHVVVNDSYGVWGLSSTTEDCFNVGDYKNPYFIFERDSVAIVHRSMAGGLLRWVATVEYPERLTELQEFHARALFNTAKEATDGSR